MDFVCPITLVPITDNSKFVYNIKDGWIYNEDAIKKWWAQNPTSPVTKEPFQLSDLLPITKTTCVFTNKSAKDLDSVVFSKDDGSLMDGYSAITWFETNKKHPTTHQNYPNGIQDLLPVYNGNAEKIPKLVKERSVNPNGQDIVFLLDNSGSMGSMPNKTMQHANNEDLTHAPIDLAESATIAFLELLLKSQKKANFSVFSFNQKVQQLFSMASLTPDNIRILKERMNQNYHPTGTTNLYLPISDTLKSLVFEHQKNLAPSRDTTIILLTDGVPQCGPDWPKTIQFIRDYLQNEFPKEMKIPTLIAIGLGDDIDALSLNKLVELFREEKKKREGNCPNQGAFVYVNHPGDLNKTIPAIVTNLIALFTKMITSVNSLPEFFHDYKAYIVQLHALLFQENAYGRVMQLTERVLKQAITLITEFENKWPDAVTDFEEIKKTLVFNKANEYQNLQKAIQTLDRWGRAYITWVLSTLQGEGLPWCVPDYMPSIQTFMNLMNPEYKTLLAKCELEFANFELPPPKSQSKTQSLTRSITTRCATIPNNTTSDSMPARTLTFDSYSGVCIAGSLIMYDEVTGALYFKNTTSLKKDDIGKTFLITITKEGKVILGKLKAVLGNKLPTSSAICESKHHPNFGKCYITPTHPVLDTEINTVMHPTELKKQWDFVSSNTAKANGVSHFVSLAFNTLTHQEHESIAPKVTSVTGYEVEEWNINLHVPFFSLFPLVKDGEAIPTGITIPTYCVAGLAHGNVQMKENTPPYMEKLVHPFYGNPNIAKVIVEMKKQLGYNDEKPFLILDPESPDYRVTQVRNPDGYVTELKIIKKRQKRRIAQDEEPPNKFPLLHILLEQAAVGSA
jgi:hypothetical protein